MKTDILIVGSGVAGLYCALKLPKTKNITIITKQFAEESDSFLAQGGICVLKSPSDYGAYFEDTMRAGHYENNPTSVDIMIQSSPQIIQDLVEYGVRFEQENGEFIYTKEGAHSTARILFHQDITGKEITSHLLEAVRQQKNITLIEQFTMVDIIVQNHICYGIIGHDSKGVYTDIQADYTVWATGGIGGLFAHSTNFEHLTGDALAIAIKHQIRLQNIDYIQTHPTTLYTKKKGRSFLISESVRGEGAILLNKNKERFIDELLPRDIVTEAIHKEMKKDTMPHVWLSMEQIPEETIKEHFTNIYKHCLSEGYDVLKECIPVVPAQHYFMGGIDVNMHSKTSMEHLYAIGETACNGVHGKNRLASNSLLESLVFAGRAAEHLMRYYRTLTYPSELQIHAADYENYQTDYKQIVLQEIERTRQSRKQ